MSALRQRAEELRAALPRDERKPPEDRGLRLATIQRAGGEELRVSLDTYEGRRFISIRIWRDSYPDPKRGIAIRLHELPAFAEGVEAALIEATKTARGPGR